MLSKGILDKGEAMRKLTDDSIEREVLYTGNFGILTIEKIKHFPGHRWLTYHLNMSEVDNKQLRRFSRLQLYKLCADLYRVMPPTGELSPSEEYRNGVKAGIKMATALKGMYENE